MPPRTCRCGCGTSVKPARKFVDKQHQLSWMRAGGASEMNKLQPVEAKRRGGAVAGRHAAETGQLASAGLVGAERSRRISLQALDAERLHDVA